MKDEGGPLGIGFQEQVSNHSKRLRLRGVVVSVGTKAREHTRAGEHPRDEHRRVISDDQPDAREGQAGRGGVTERFVVPLKLGNAGGGKGPQFKTDATSGEGPGDWVT